MATVSVRHHESTSGPADDTLVLDALALAGEPLAPFTASRLDRAMALADLAQCIVSTFPLITSSDRATLVAVLYPEGVTA
jgi:hypothetical protein